MITEWMEKIKASMGLKLVAAQTAVFLAVTLIGMVFLARMLTQNQYQNVQTRGRNSACFSEKLQPIQFFTMTL